MRCRSCNALLTDREATNKDPITGEYLDTCNDCLGEEEQDEEDDPTLEEYLESAEDE